MINKFMKHIPNTITLLNLFCGCAAIVSVLYGQFVSAFWWLFVAGLIDYLDGFVARWLKVNSPLGKELDSLADMVSFGVAPGAILYMLLNIGLQKEGNMGDLSANFALFLPALPAFVLSMFSGLRLAKFNLDTRQSENFIGLPTPACTIFVTGLMLIYEYNSLGMSDFVTNPIFIYIVTASLSYLLVAEIPMFSLKFKGVQWKANEIRYIFIILTFILFFTIKQAAFSVIIFLYIIFALIQVIRKLAK